MTEEIVNAIIAGIGSADTTTEQAIGVMEALERAGYVIAPAVVCKAPVAFDLSEFSDD